MKIILLFLFVTSAYALDPMSEIVKAYSNTENGKEVSKRIEDKVLRSVENVPKDVLNITALGIQQRFDYQIDQNHIIHIDYREQSVSYFVNYPF